MTVDPNNPNDLGDDPYIAWARAQQLQVLPGELSKSTGGDPLAPPPPAVPPPPPPQPAPSPAPAPKSKGTTLGPRGRKMISAIGSPTQEEVPADALATTAPSLTPEEEAQIEIDQPPPAKLSPEEEAQIEIDRPAPSASYQTLLSPDDEAAFQGWAHENKAPITDDYDMRGFWKGLVTGDPRATTAINPSDGQLHFPDTWKTPSHATFSNESIYAQGGEPRWIGDVLVAQDGTIVADERSAAEKKANPVPDFAYSLSYDQAQKAPSPEDVAAYGSPDAYLAHMQQVAAEEPLPSMREQTLDDATQRAVNAMTPQQFQQFRDSHAARLLLEQSRQAHEAELANEQRARQALDIQRAATAKADADTKDMLAQSARLAATRINPDRYVQTRGIGGTVRDMAGIFLMGLGGNAEAGLNMFNQKIDRDIAAQTADLENGWKGVNTQRNAIAEEYARHGDLYRAQETYRLAAYQSARDDLLTLAQRFDPASAKAITAREGADTLQAAINQAAAAQNQKAFDNTINSMKAEAEYNEKMANARKAQQETIGLQIKQSAMGAGATKSKPVYGTIYNNADFATLPENVQHRGFQLPSKNGQPGGWVLANSDDVAKDATHLVKMYNQADYDLNELQKISVARNGAKSAGGSIWKEWQDTQEQHYQQLLLDVANVYGMMIHGRAPTAGVMEEIIKVAPELKSAWQRGDTTELIDKFRNDIDNRMSLELQDFTGGAHRLTSARPVAAQSNANTIASDLTTPAIKGDLGYARFDVRNYGEGIERLFKEYSENPGLGGSAGFAKQMDESIAAQQKAADTIRADIDKVSAKKKRTNDDNAQLIAARKALGDREEAIKEANDAKKRNVEAEAARKAAEARQEMEDQAAADDRSAGYGM